MPDPRFAATGDIIGAGRNALMLIAVWCLT
jgi:hypothetical protein